MQGQDAAAREMNMGDVMDRIRKLRASTVVLVDRVREVRDHIGGSEPTPNSPPSDKAGPSSALLYAMADEVTTLEEAVAEAHRLINRTANKLGVPPPNAAGQIGGPRLARG